MKRRTKAQRAALIAASHTPAANAKRRATLARNRRLKEMAEKDANWVRHGVLEKRYAPPVATGLNPDERAHWAALVGLLVAELQRK